MDLFEFPELFFVQVAIAVVGVAWFLKRNDEIPLIVGVFFLYVGSYRFLVVSAGIEQWLPGDLVFGLASVTTTAAVQALASIVLGEIVLVGCYFLFQRKRLPVSPERPIDRRLMKRVSIPLLLLGAALIPLTVTVRSNVFSLVGEGASLAFEVSGYLYLFPLAVVGVATLIVWLWRYVGFDAAWQKVVAVLIMVGAFNFTFGPSGRFQFIGWMMAGALVWTSVYSARNRLVTLVVAVVVSGLAFSLAGAMRAKEFEAADWQRAAWERAYRAVDANMLDGFVFLQQVYPERLDFSYGGEHLEILLRPIPRAWWPEKPVGGYINKLGLYRFGQGATLGFSPTLFGSFYAEGGVLGILLFSALYGTLLAALVTRSSGLQPHVSTLIRAVAVASLVPLLRGGDLPGIYSWVAMSFWPVFVVLWLGRGQLGRVRRVAPGVRPGGLDFAGPGRTLRRERVE